MWKSQLILSMVVVGFLRISLGLSLLPGQNSSSSGVSTVVNAVGNVSDAASRLTCEMSPTSLICNSSVKYGHKIEQNLPPEILWRPCSFLLATPHCCSQFCKPASKGICDMETQACFCEPSGRPNVCGLLIDDGSPTPLGTMNSNDKKMLSICQEKCLKNTNGCQKAAAATDGIAGTVCVCYCESTSAPPSTPSTLLGRILANF